MCFFVFTQMSAYEMPISDWSSDVCSSDLLFMYLIVALFKSYVNGDSLISGNIFTLGQSMLDVGDGGAFDEVSNFLSNTTGIILRGKGDRKSVVSAKRVSVRELPGGRRIIEQQIHK